MQDTSLPVIFLPGAGGGRPDFDVFRDGVNDKTRFEAIRYPGWKRCASDGFSAEVLIAELVAEIEARIPQGPIRIIGLSIGGHFGYAAALRLKAMGREIAGLCAIDTFMFTSSKPSAGWKGRALDEGLELLRGWRFGDFIRFVRSRFWRALVRLAGSRLPGLLRRFSSFGLQPSFSAVDPVFEQELSMRSLVEVVTPWIASLDREPIALESPAILLRTNLTAADDAAWRRRCPNIKIFELPGQHHSLFEAEYFDSTREVFISATPDWRKTP